MLGDIAGNLALGLNTALTPWNLFYCFIGVAVGTIVGVIPGLGALAAVSMLFPITFHLDPIGALVMLSGIFYGASYGGSTASILLNLPGTTSSAVVCIDGYPMMKQGRAGVALFTTTIASFIGGSLAIVVLMVASPLLVQIAFHLGAPEYFSLILFGLVAASTISIGSQLRSIAMVTLGILLSMIGTDLYSGIQRYTFGYHELSGGLSLVALAMGLFGVSEVISSISSFQVRTLYEKVTWASMKPTRGDMKRSMPAILRGWGIGSFFGALPGTGGTVASFMSYAVEKHVSKVPEEFGHGAIEGVAGPESANNAADQASFIPTLTLGIPGSATMALMLGVFMIHGIVPGPTLMTDHPDLFWGLIMSFWVGNLMLLVLNIPLIGVFIRIMLIPYHILFPAVIMFICIGVYTVNNSHIDIYVVAMIGLLGYILKVLEFEVAPVILGFILGPMLEEYMRRALTLSRGSFEIFLSRPISLILLLLTGALVVLGLWRAYADHRLAKQTAMVDNGT